MKSYYTKLEDGSEILEVISPDVRFGINIESKAEESGWWYVSKDMASNSSGYLPPEFQRLLTKRAGGLPLQVRILNAICYGITAGSLLWLLFGSR